MEKFYSTGLSLSISKIKAESKDEANAIMNQFIDRIAGVMDDLIKWDECDGKIEENVLTDDGWEVR